MHPSASPVSTIAKHSTTRPYDRNAENSLEPTHSPRKLPRLEAVPGLWWDRHRPRVRKLADSEPCYTLGHESPYVAAAGTAVSVDSASNSSLAAS